MGLMDRVKQQASNLAQQANQGMARLDNLPAQRRADALLRSLGVAVLAERTGRASADTQMQGPGEFLTSAPPADPNAPAMPAAPGGGGPGAAPGYGGVPGYGGQPAP